MARSAEKIDDLTVVCSKIDYFCDQKYLGPYDYHMAKIMDASSLTIRVWDYFTMTPEDEEEAECNECEIQLSRKGHGTR
uniref:BED-type domain-containing protein n=1 Tax=Romanomermis culicivorax TaxID=13658 RepID=A0A915IGH8_ROMCU